MRAFGPTLRSYIEGRDLEVVVLAKSDLIDKLGVVPFSSIPSRAFVVRPFDCTLRFFAEPCRAAARDPRPSPSTRCSAAVGESAELTASDRFLWAWLSTWRDWRSALMLVQPQTVIGWHRKGFRLFRKWKSRHGRRGRPSVGDRNTPTDSPDKPRKPALGRAAHPRGSDFTQQVKELGIQEVLGTPRAPQQRAYVERVIGTIRRECLDHVIIFNEASLSRHLKLFLEYYHQSRTHLSLEKDTPEKRSVQPPESGCVVAVPQVGGLHHRYERRAA